MIIDLSFVFISSLAYLFILRKAAKKVGLVDIPSGRKQHQGVVPLVGGLTICLVLLQYLYNNPELLAHSLIYSGCIIVLSLMGAIDDKFDISFKIRLFTQAIISLVMMYYAQVELHSLGNFLGLGNIELGVFSPLFTVIAVIAAINAFNMVDGIDGLLGGLACVSLGSLGFVFYLHNKIELAQFCLVICAAALPYILFNLGAFGKTRKVFMGDAGSMLIGFTVIWLLLQGSQTNDTGSPIRPVTALWLIAVPLMDMASVMLRRIKRGQSPFKPDREHLHHIFQRVGLDSKLTLISICSIALSFALIGIVADVYQVPEPVMFYSFLALFGLYQLFLSRIWRITAKVRQLNKSVA